MLFSRRHVTGVAFAAPFLARTAFAKPLAELQLFGPPAGPSIIMAHGVATGAFAELADKVTFKTWRNPDEMRAGLTSGTMPLVIMPTTTAANLYNRGLGVKLVNIMTDGLLYVVSDEPLSGFSALKGKKLAVPFRNDTPEFVLNRLLKHYSLSLDIETTGTPIEAVQLLLAGRINAALVPEPAATAAIVKGATGGKTIHRSIDIQKEWAKMTGEAAQLPQAGLATTGDFLGKHPDIIAKIQNILPGLVAGVIANPAKAANSAASALDMPWPVLEKSIPFSNLVATPAKAARKSLELMFRTVSDANAALIGGKLPDDGFYL